MMTVGRRLRFLDCPVDAVTMEETVSAVRQMIDSERPHVHACVNAAKIVALRKNPGLADAIRRADLVSADGQSVVWAARLMGLPIPERVAGIDLMIRLLGEAEKAGFSVFFLGSTDEVLRSLEQSVRATHPGLIIAGMHHGYFAEGDEPGLLNQIRQARPHILFLGISSPRKEVWLEANRDRLGVSFAMGVGGSFDVLAGHRRRAPKWAQRMGLEWALRLFQEPRRMWRRYLVGNATFIWLVLRAIGKR